MAKRLIMAPCLTKRGYIHGSAMHLLKRGHLCAGHNDARIEVSTVQPIFFISMVVAATTTC
jgi:hypothetical protein